MNFYELLGVDCSASTDTIKKKYQYLVLQHHPDKQNQSSSGSPEQFLAITEAWNCLKNEQTRREYDSQLMQSRSGGVDNFYAKLKFEDLEKEKRFSFPCRCGFEFEIESQGSGELIYECEDCSLCILVDYNR